MNLYLITQTSNNRKYDVFKNAVVVAESFETARFIHPDDNYRWSGKKWIYKDESKFYHDVDQTCWVDPYDVNITLLGEASDCYEEGTVINYSFKAG